MSDLAVFYSKDFLNHKAPAFHPENENRLISIYKALEKVKFYNSSVIEPRLAEPKEIELVHTKEHLKKVKKASQESGYLDPDTFTSPGSYNAALKAAGSVLQAVQLIQSGKTNKAFCLVRPPGHHALRDRAMGFCLFNNVAVGASQIASEYKKRVAILDFDAHHGNGTQSIFYDNDKVFYCSWHQWPHYPGTGSLDEIGAGNGKGYTLNIPLPAGSGDDLLIDSLDNLVLPILRQYKPALIIISAGYDSHKYDPLSSLMFTEAGYSVFTSRISEFSEDTAAGLIYCLEGGYNLDALQNSVLKCFAILADVQVETKRINHYNTKPSLVEKVKESIKSFWTLED